MPEVNNIAEALRAQAADRPDGIALIVPTRRGPDGRWQDKRWTYRQLNDLSDRLAAGLQRQGIAPGTRVAFMVPPSMEFFALFFALFKAGCVPVLIDPGIGLKPLKSCLGEARPEVFIGVTRAQIARMLLGWARGHIKRIITVGPRPFGIGLRYRDLLTENATDFEPPADDESPNPRPPFCSPPAPPASPRGWSTGIAILPPRCAWCATPTASAPAKSTCRRFRRSRCSIRRWA